MIAEQVKVVAGRTFSGPHRGDYMGIPATNKKVSVDGMTIHHVAGGKIMDSYSNWDAFGMMQQLGVLPALRHTKNLTAPSFGIPRGGRPPLRGWPTSSSQIKTIFSPRAPTHTMQYTYAGKNFP